jgi:hypothetical protein
MRALLLPHTYHPLRLSTHTPDPSTPVQFFLMHAKVLHHRQHQLTGIRGLSQIFVFCKPSIFALQRRARREARCSWMGVSRAALGGRTKSKVGVAAANGDKAALPPRFSFLALFQKRLIGVDLDSWYYRRL